MSLQKILKACGVLGLLAMWSGVAPVKAKKDLVLKGVEIQQVTLEEAPVAPQEIWQGGR